MSGQTKRAEKRSPLGILLPVALFVALAAVLMLRGGGEPESVSGNTGTVRFNAQGDLVIPMAEVTEQATFYPVEMDGVALEVLAVRATDGTVRTAFNTCQVCYGSGRGYYEQQDSYLVCQNCGNRFHTDDVEVVRGGCNPIPIMEDFKSVDDAEITVPSGILEEASVIFTNWRR